MSNAFKRYTGEYIEGGRYKDCSIEREPGDREYRIYDNWDRFIGRERSLAQAKETINAFLSEPERQTEGYVNK